MDIRDPKSWMDLSGLSPAVKPPAAEFEPEASPLQTGRSTELSYRPIMNGKQA